MTMGREFIPALKRDKHGSLKWKGQLIGGGAGDPSYRVSRRGLALRLEGGATTWDWLRVENHGKAGWAVVHHGETIYRAAGTEAWHLRADGTPSNEGAKDLALNLYWEATAEQARVVGS